MKREEIKKILPHREPMLLIDEANLLDEATAEGFYTVRGDEYFLQGHFPGNPVVPGVILCEIMAQTCCVLMGEGGNSEGMTPYYTGLNNVKFKQPVVPGDTIRMDCSLQRVKKPV
jgi:3-hydroxyacyl-[acyl-carrier-protein] dehydratase